MKQVNVSFPTINNFVALTETMEVGCLRLPGATTIGSQFQDGDLTDNPAMSPRPHNLDKTVNRYTATQWKALGWGREGTKTPKCYTHNAPTSPHTDK